MMEIELLTTFVMGGVLYGAIETLWRGRTHWTMLVLGGICFSLIYLIASRSRLGRVRQVLLCAAVVTTLEFVTGAVVNVALGWGVWDYSDRPYNLCGQICLQYFLYWLALCVPGCVLARLLRRYLFGGGSV